MGNKKKPRIRTIEECQEIIDAIYAFKETVDPIDNRASNKLAFLLGEYDVLKRVLDIYPHAEHYGGQGHCDIIVPNPYIEIEVKTSTYKPSRAYIGLDNWGWTVETEKQKEKRKENKKPRFDYVIAVALDNETWKNPEIFIIPWKEAIKHNRERPIKGLSNINMRIELFKNEYDLNTARKNTQGTNDPDLSPTNLEELLVKTPQQFQNWDVLSKKD
jgi:hypothetical protein